MAFADTCPRCGTLLFREAAAGLCPKCLGTLGFGAGDEGGGANLAEDTLRPHRLGDYELIEEIARGGMGVVYKARQIRLNRTVAVKVVLHGPFASPEFGRRFQTEAAIVAGLQHPNIVAVHEAGQDGGNHYFSMEYIEGKSLAELVREHPLPARRAATYLKTIAEAVDYAHQRGVLHRDLKPSNVLLDVFDQPKVTDFGLAKLLTSDVELTATGQVLGSPSHISPEQAAGKSGAATAAGDIYSSGAILYHLVTGRPPFQGDTVTEILMQVQNSEPVAPRQLNPSVPMDLQTICMKCLQKEPSRRYGSARELAEDITRFLTNEPILARPIGWPGRLARWCQRKPALAASLGVAGALLLIVAIGSPIAVLHIDRERRSAESARRQESTSRVRAESAEMEAQKQLFAALFGQARATVRNGEAGQRFGTLDALRRAAAISNAVELRREALTALSLPDMRPQRMLPYGQDYTLRQLDPTFSRIALCRGIGPVEIRDSNDGTLLASLSATTNLEAHVAKWSLDGRSLAVKRDRGSAGLQAEWELWELTGPRLVSVLKGAVLNAVAFHPDGKRIAAATEGKAISFRDLSDGRQTMRLRLPELPFQLAFDEGGGRFVVARQAAAGFLIAVHDATNGTMLSSHLSKERVHHLKWEPGGRRIALLQSSGMVSLVDALSGDATVLGRHKSAAVDAEFSADGAYLMTVGWDRELNCWDLRTMRRVFFASLDGVTLQLRRDSRVCAVNCSANVQLYEFAAPVGCREFTEDLGGRLNRAAFSPDARWLAASALKHAGVWDLARPGPGALLNTDGGAEARVTFTADGQLFVNHRRDCSRWQVLPSPNPESPPVLEPLPMLAPSGFVSLSLLSNGVILTGSEGSKFSRFETLSTQPGDWKRTVNGLNGVSADQHLLGMHTAYSDEFCVYRLPEIEPLAKLRSAAAIHDFAFSPSGKELAIGSDGGVQFWSTATWRQIRTLTNFTGALYSPDGMTCWLWAEHRGAGLFRTDTAESLLPLPANMRPLAISLDGRWLAVNVDAQRLQLWDMVELRRQLRALGTDWTDNPPM